MLSSSHIPKESRRIQVRIQNGVKYSVLQLCGQCIIYVKITFLIQLILPKRLNKKSFYNKRVFKPKKSNKKNTYFCMPYSVLEMTMFLEYNETFFCYSFNIQFFLQLKAIVGKKNIFYDLL